MNYKVFAIFDSKAGYYKPPFMMRNKGEAIRGFQQLANDGKSQIALNPEDFVLFEIGEFDDQNAIYTQDNNKSLGCAIEFVKVNN